MALDEHGDIAGLASSLGGTLQMLAGGLMIVAAGPFFDGTVTPMLGAIALCGVLVLALSRLVRSRQAAAAAPEVRRRAASSTSSPAPLREACSDRTRRQPRAPGFPVKRPSMWRVIWCRRPACSEVIGDVGAHRVHDGEGVRRIVVAPKRIGPDQDRGWVVIGRAADHHAIEALIEQRSCLRQGW